MAQSQTYQQLTQEERDTLAVLHAQGVSLSQIARQLHRDKSTISRELKRNKTPILGLYRSGRAHQQAKDRKRQAGERERLKSPEIRRYVKQHLRMNWSPERIAGRLRVLHADRHICVESIYQFIYDSEQRNQEDFVPNLARSHRIRNYRGQRKTHRMLKIPNRTSILERSAIVQNRTQAGHWETDTMISRASKAAVLATVERTSRYVKLAKLRQRTARHVRISLNRMLSRYEAPLLRSITYDNGQENTDHMDVNKILGTRSYFCQPYHSWEKGTVENTIGLVRRTYPKKTDFAKISAAEIKSVERKLNNMPRKVLHYKTPKEVFDQLRCTSL